ncbi:MAG: hypothetical protein GX219_04345 [Tissierellia bacterium]|nr:hypothetical protein [Tissierellia bacterium]
MLKTLIKKDLLLDYGFFFNFKDKTYDSKVQKKYVAYFFIGLLALFYAFLYVKLMLSLYDSFAGIGAEDLYLALNISLSKTAVILFVIPLIFAKFYFSKDIDILIRLPISRENIYRSKIISMSIGFSAFALFLSIFQVFKYGRETSKGWWFYPEAVIGIVSSTIIAITLISFVIVVFMRLVNKHSKTKVILQTIGIFFILFLSFGYQYLMQKYIGNDMEFIAIESTIANLVKKVNIAFPDLILLNRALTSSNFIGSLSFLTIPSLAYAVFMLITLFGRNMLVDGVIMGKSVHSVKGSLKDDNYKSGGVVLSLFKREIMDLIRTPTYIYNVLAVGLIFIAMLIFIVFLNSGLSFMQIREIVSSLFFNQLNKPTDQVIFGLLAGSIITLLMASPGQSASSSISREGKLIWLLKVLPIKIKDIIDSKILTSLVIESVTLIVLAIILLILSFPLVFILGFLLSSLVTIFLVANLGLFLDITKPRLDWDNPSQPVKRNFANMVMSFVYSFGFVGLFSFASLINWNKVVSYVKFGPVLLILNMIIGLILYRTNIKKLEKRLKEY